MFRNYFLKINSILFTPTIISRTIKLYYHSVCMTSYKSNAAYQRRQGGLSENQTQLLATSTKLLEINSLQSLIKKKEADRPTILEIGFGTGDHLIYQAKQNPLVDFIGIDLYLLGVASLLQKAEQEALSNVWALSADAYLFLTTPPEVLLQFFTTIYIFHPDPWPKKRHHKRRLLNADTLTGAYKLLKRGGTIEILSDEDSYTEAITSHITECFRNDHTITSPVSPKTKYGEKAIREGRTITQIVITKPVTE